MGPKHLAGGLEGGRAHAAVQQEALRPLCPRPTPGSKSESVQFPSLNTGTTAPRRGFPAAQEPFQGPSSALWTETVVRGTDGGPGSRDMTLTW